MKIQFDHFYFPSNIFFRIQNIISRQIMEISKFGKIKFAAQSIDLLYEKIS
jgi:hypothetical protein